MEMRFGESAPSQQVKIFAVDLVSLRLPTITVTIGNACQNINEMKKQKKKIRKIIKVSRCVVWVIIIIDWLLHLFSNRLQSTLFFSKLFWKFGFEVNACTNVWYKVYYSIEIWKKNFQIRRANFLVIQCTVMKIGYMIRVYRLFPSKN